MSDLISSNNDFYVILNAFITNTLDLHRFVHTSNITFALGIFYILEGAIIMSEIVMHIPGCTLWVSVCIWSKQGGCTWAIQCNEDPPQGGPNFMRSSLCPVAPPWDYILITIMHNMLFYVVNSNCAMPTDGRGGCVLRCAQQYPPEPALPCILPALQSTFVAWHCIGIVLNCISDAPAAASHCIASQRTGPL